MLCQRSRKHKERKRLELLIISVGCEMPSCSFCEQNNCECIVAEGSTRCSECVRRGKRCNVDGLSASDIDAVLCEEECLKLEEEQAQADACEAIARVDCLYKQRESLRS